MKNLKSHDLNWFQMYNEKEHTFILHKSTWPINGHVGGMGASKVTSCEFERIMNPI